MIRKTLCKIIGSVAAIVAIFAACCVDSEGDVGIIAVYITLAATIIGYAAYAIYDYEDNEAVRRNGTKRDTYDFDTGRWKY